QSPRVPGGRLAQERHGYGPHGSLERRDRILSATRFPVRGGRSGTRRAAAGSTLPLGVDGARRRSPGGQGGGRCAGARPPRNGVRSARLPLDAHGAGPAARGLPRSPAGGFTPTAVVAGGGAGGPRRMAAGAGASAALAGGGCDQAVNAVLQTRGAFPNGGRS